MSASVVFEIGDLASELYIGKNGNVIEKLLNETVQLGNGKNVLAEIFGYIIHLKLYFLKALRILHIPFPSKESGTCRIISGKLGSSEIAMVFFTQRPL